MKRIKEERVRLNMLQKGVAECIGVDRTTYAKYETGSIMPPVDVLQNLADMFGVSLDYLTERTNIRNGSVESPISVEEQEIIDMYKKLNEEGQKTAMNTMRALAAYKQLTMDMNVQKGDEA